MQQSGGGQLRDGKASVASSAADYGASEQAAAQGNSSSKQNQYQQYLEKMQKEIHDEKMKRFIEHT